MTPTKDAAELSAERLAAAAGELDPLLFTLDAKVHQYTDGYQAALRAVNDELQRVRAASAGSRESWSIEAPEIGVELGADGSLVTLDRYGRTIRTLRAASAGSAWQPIATAPRDESWLLLYADIFGEPSVHAGFWSEGDWYDSEAASKPLRDVWAEPTHWQRFSAPTSQPAEEARCGTCDNLGAIKDPEKDLQIYGSDDYVPCPDCRPAEAPATAPQSAGDVLLPCPFCGGKAEHDTDDLGCHGIRCMDCTIYLGAYSTKNRAAQVWNKRPSTAAAISEGEREALERAAKAVEHCATLPDTTVGGARLAETDAAFLRSLVARLSLDKEPTKNKS
jgi:hypothetical protein